MMHIIPEGGDDFLGERVFHHFVGPVT